MKLRQTKKQKFFIRSLAIALCTLTLLCQFAGAQIAPREKHLPIIDVRQENMPAGLIADTFVVPQQREAEKYIRRIYPNLNLNLFV